MTVKINEVGVVVPGSITRKYDSNADETTLTFNQDQAREVYTSLGTVLEFFDRQDDRGGAL